MTMTATPASVCRPKQQETADEQHARGYEATNDVGGDPLDDLRKQTCIAAASRDLRESRCSHSG